MTQPGDERSWFGRHRIAVALAAVAAAAIGFLALSGDSRPEEPGAQVPGPASRIRGPGTRVWVELTPADGTPRAGWPPPMISRGAEVCFGFGRLDFAPPTRPTLARCVDAAEIPELRSNELVGLVFVQAGTDNWHLLATGADVTSFDVTTAAGEPIEAGRVHLDDELVALRLPNAARLAEVSWIVGRNRVVCTPAADASSTGIFCRDEAAP